MHTRRSFLKTAAAATGSALAVTATSSPAAASHWEHQPENVTITYDATMLETYRPELVFSDVDREKFVGLFGWVATSPDYDTDVCVYWTEYTHQEGWLANLDSHDGDHEPLYVFVNSDTGAIEQLVGSIYHWIAGRAYGDSIPLQDDTHPHLRVMNPHHQYTAATEAGIRDPVEDLTAYFQDWLDHGLEDALEPGVVVNPWRMQSRGDWWRRGRTGISMNAVLVNAAKTAGIDRVGSLTT